MRKGQVFIGTSGWNYPHWRGIFYPQDLKTGQWLCYYARHFHTVEINATFYHLPKKSVFENWCAITPENFAFVIKASRFITHIKKLIDPEITVGKFLEHAAGLGAKLHLILFQLPPVWQVNASRLEHFVRFLTARQILPACRFVLELRNPTWQKTEVFDLLRSGNMALCFADWPDLVLSQPVTADFVYLRRHGPGALYASRYTPEHLQQDACNIRSWLEQGKDVYVYFNNDAYGWALANAHELRQLISGL